MRKSVVIGDPAYFEPGSEHWRVRVDGELVADVVTADEEAGTAVRFKRGERNRVMFNGDEPVTETLHGVVVLEQEPSQ